jgi:hypothetical protein
MQHKKRILKVAREKWHITQKGKPIIIIADFSTEVKSEEDMEWCIYFKPWKKITANLDYCIKQSCTS